MRPINGHQHVVFFGFSCQFFNGNIYGRVARRVIKNKQRIRIRDTAPLLLDCIDCALERTDDCLSSFVLRVHSKRQTLFLHRYLHNLPSNLIRIVFRHLLHRAIRHVKIYDCPVSFVFSRIASNNGIEAHGGILDQGGGISFPIYQVSHKSIRVRKMGEKVAIEVPQWLCF